MPRRQLLGILVAAVSAITFASNLTLASLAYDGGSNVHALNLSRSVLFAVLLMLVIVAGRLTLRMSRRDRLICIGLGFIFCIDLYAILIAIQYVPVGLAILIMYTYPLLLAAFSWLTGREGFSFDALCAVLATFLGLGLTLYAPGGNPDWRGVALALVTAVGLATLLVLSEKVMQRHDRRVVMFHLATVSSLFIAVVAFTVAGLEWPNSPHGWLAFAGSSLLYAVATFLLFTAVDLIGPLRTSLIDNAAPVVAIFLSAWLLAEHLRGSQLLGGALVLAGVTLVQLSLAVPVSRRSGKSG